MLILYYRWDLSHKGKSYERVNRATMLRHSRGVNSLYLTSPFVEIVNSKLELPMFMLF